MPLERRFTVQVHRLGSVVMDRFAERLLVLGLRPQDFKVLAVLAVREIASQQDLGRILQQAPSGIVPILDGLERAGAVRRTRGDVDRRHNVLALTARGRELLAEADRVAAELDEDLCASLEPADRALLTDLLARVSRQAGVPTLLE